MTSMSQWAAGPLTFAAALLLGGPAGALYAADPGEAAAPEFAFVPADAAAVVSVRFGDLWNNEALRPARDRLLKDQSDEVTMFTERTGLELGELDRVTAAYGSGGDGTIFLATARPYDHKKVAAAAAKGAQEQKVNDRTLYLHGDGAATILLLDANTLVIGTAENVRALAKRNGPAPKGALTPALRAGAEKRLVLVAWDAAALSAITQPPFPEFAPLMKAELAVLAADLNGQDLAGELRLKFAAEADARDGKKGVLATRDKSLELVRWLNDHTAGPDADKYKASLAQIESSLKGLEVVQDGPAVKATLKMKIDPAVTADAFLKGMEEDKKKQP